MNAEERPDPEALLKAIRESENKREKGRLKIFLGMAAGVGKTYAMLEAAQKKMQEGVYVLVGVVNTHGRPETAKLLEPLEAIEEKTIVYKGKEFKELDVDEILKRKPQLVLIDELAHSNIPGSKHVKRWQDVVEILEARIDVYTTLNVQHIESYKDIVESITGITIRETVPDLVLEQATDIACIDLTPNELLDRLKEGKVYTADLTAVAIQNFFQEDRLTALREIALRCTAEIVDLELHELIKVIRKGKRWKPRERLLVAINHHSYSQQLIRVARRLAFSLHAPWKVVYVDALKKLSDEELAMLSKNLALARELGAEVITTQNRNIASGIQQVAEQNAITQIIIGKSFHTKLSHFFKGSIVDRLSKISSDIDVYIVRQLPFFDHKKRLTLKPGLFRPKRLKLLRKNEQSMLALYEIVRAISTAPTSVELFDAIKSKLGSILQGTCEIVPRANGGLNFEGVASILEDEKEKAVARWVFENGKEAGWSTFTLPSVKNYYIPLKGFKESVGVLAFRPLVDQPFLPEETGFLYTVAQLIANFLERSFFEQREKKNEIIEQMEQIYAKVLQSISDELFTPLKIIQSAVDSFKEEKRITEDLKLIESLEQIENTSESLMHIAENAKSMATLNARIFTFEESHHHINELINACVKRVQESLKHRFIKIHVEENVPQITFDFSLMSILLHHLLTNAIEYSPPYSTIEIAAEVFDGTFVLSVSDQGRGIPEEIKELVFEKFYRAQGAVSPGLGLGLAIVKSIAEIHHGSIKVQNREEGGTKFSLILPL